MVAFASTPLEVTAAVVSTVGKAMIVLSIKMIACQQTKTNPSVTMGALALTVLLAMSAFAHLRKQVGSQVQKVHSPNLSHEKSMSEVVRIGRLIIFHLSKLWKAQLFFILCDFIFLLRLQGKFEVDHSWEVKGLQFPLQCHRNITPHSMKNFSKLAQMKDDYYNHFLLPHLYIYLWEIVIPIVPIIAITIIIIIFSLFL